MGKITNVIEVNEDVMENSALKFTIKNRQLTLSQFVEYVDYVLDQVFITNEQGETEYKGRYVDIAIKSAFLDYYTTYDFKEELEENYKEYANLDTWEYEDAINFEQFNDLKSAINEEIEFKKQQLIHNKKTSLDSLLDNINGIVTKIDGSLDMSSLSTLLPQLAKLGETGLDQNSLVDQILKNMPKKPTDRKKKTPTKKADLKVVESPTEVE